MQRAGKVATASRVARSAPAVVQKHRTSLATSVVSQVTWRAIVAVCDAAGKDHGMAGARGLDVAAAGLDVAAANQVTGEEVVTAGAKVAGMVVGGTETDRGVAIGVLAATRAPVPARHPTSAAGEAGGEAAAKGKVVERGAAVATMGEIGLVRPTVAAVGTAKCTLTAMWTSVPKIGTEAREGLAKV